MERIQFYPPEKSTRKFEESNAAGCIIHAVLKKVAKCDVINILISLP